MMLLPTTVPADDSAGTRMLYAPEVSVVRFNAAADADGQVWLRWTTEAEMGSGLFLVRRQRIGAPWEAVGTGGPRLHGDEASVDYVWRDPAAQLGETLRYALIFLSRNGVEQQAAQWEGVVAQTKRPPSEALPAKASLSDAPLAVMTEPQTWIGNGPRVRGWIGDAPADRVRLSLRETGVYRVTAQELAEAGGWDAADVAAAMAVTNLSLSCQGAPVAWLADDDAIIFHGVRAESLLAPENVYWVMPGTGTGVARQSATPPSIPVTNAWFAETAAFRGTNHLTRVSYNSRTDLPFLAYGLRSDSSADKTIAVVEPLPDPAPGNWTGTVGVALLSYYENTAVDEHAAQVLIGETSVGVTSWSGERLVTNAFPFSSGDLSGGSVSIKVRHIADAPPWYSDDYTRFLWLSSRVTYRRAYRARQGALRCRGGDGNVSAVAGFITNDVVVLDVTAAHAPVWVESVSQTFDAGDAKWTAVFTSGGADRTYEVFSASTGVRQPAVRGVRDVDWSLPEHAAAYAILVPPEGWVGGFREAVQPLADARNAQGLRTKIVDVEAIYNTFSHGVVDPLAIRSFCAAVYPQGLRYLLLAGAGSFDFQHRRLSVNDYTACLIPTLMAGQRFLSGEDMVAAIDGALGDIDGDGLPEVAVGRLPTTRTQQVAVAVQKVMAFESSRLWKRQASVTADWDCTGIPGKEYPFSAGTDRLVAPLSKDGRVVATYYTSDPAGSLEAVRLNQLLPALTSGSGLFHFFGHANELRLGYRSANHSLLRNTDITVANWGKPTIAVLISCLPNRWQSPFTSTPNVFLPYGLFAAGTGFVAGMGATAYMLDKEGEDFAIQLYAAGGVVGTRRLGDLWLRGLRGMAGVIPSERLLAYSLIGDPTVVFFHRPNPGTFIQLK